MRILKMIQVMKIAQSQETLRSGVIKLMELPLF